MSLSVITVTLSPAIDHTILAPKFAPGKVNRVAEGPTSAGGKGVNVAAFLAHLGVRVAATGFLGQDNAGPFEKLFRQKNIEDCFIRIPGTTRTGIKIVDEARQETTDLSFPSPAPPSEAVDQFFQLMATLSRPGRWFVFSGSVPNGLGQNAYARLIKLVRAGGGHVALDTSGQALSLAVQCGPDFVKPNVAEMEELIGHPLKTRRDVTEAALAVQRQGVALVVVSMGERGSVWVDRQTSLWVQAPSVAAHNTSGAGDAMVSGIVYGRMQDWALRECAVLSAALATCVVAARDRALDLTRVDAYRKEIAVKTMKLKQQQKRRIEGS